MIQKHKVINELNAKVVDLTKKCSAFEEKLYMAENDVTSHRSRTPSAFDDLDSITSSIVKKRKLDNYVLSPNASSSNYFLGLCSEENQR